MTQRLLAATFLAVSVFPCAAPAQELAVHTGFVVFPLFYGQTPASGNASRKVTGHLGTDLTFKIAEGVHIGGSLDGTYVDGEYDQTEGFIYSIAVGPTGMLTSESFTGKKWVFGLSLTPEMLALGAVADAGGRRHSLTAGASTELSLRVRVTQRILLGAFTSFGVYGPPFTNRALGSDTLGITMISYFDLGLIWRF